MTQEIKLDDLAEMLHGQFAAIDKNFSEIKGEFQSMRKEVSKRFDGVEKDISDLKQGQEEIIRKFGYVAWNMDLAEVKENSNKRLDILEKKVLQK